MFKLKHLAFAPEDEAGGAMAPPIDSMPDDHVDEGHVAAPEGAEAAEAAAAPAGDDATDSEAPKTALDAVNEALDKALPKDDGEGKGKPAAPQDKAKADAQTDEPSKDKAVDTEALYKIPTGAKGEVRAAYKALSDHARGLDAQLAERTQAFEAAQQRVTTMDEIIRESGASAEVLAGHFEYIAAVNSGNLEQALAFIEGERAALARALGKPLEGVDLYAEYPDIKQRLDNMEIDEPTARELMQARRAQQRTAHDAHQAEQRAAYDAQVAQYQGQRNTALTEIDAWMKAESAGMLPTDWQGIEDALVAYLQAPETQTILAEISPAHWLSHIKQQYAFLKQHAGAQRPAATPTPLRPRGAGVAVDKAPSSALEAMELKLGYK